MEGRSADAGLPVPVSPYGPLNELGRRVHELTTEQRIYEALAAADEYEATARAFGDNRTVGFLIQGRMYAYSQLGHDDEAMAAGRALLAHHRAAGDVLGEAKTLSDLADIAFRTGLVVEGMRYLARAGLLLENTSRRGGRYVSALASYSLAAPGADLYEVADAGYQRLTEHLAPTLPTPVSYYFDEVHLYLLLLWGLRLDQLGHTTEARSRLRQAATITEEWLTAVSDPGQRREIDGIRALVLAKLGDIDAAVALAEPVVRLGARDSRWAAWSAHMALGIAWRVRDDLAAARRELLAARRMSESGLLVRTLPYVQHELALLAAQAIGTDASGDLLAAIRLQADQIWQQRLQRVAMLRQARQREELEIEWASTEAALMFDPLTGLGNRRRFDQLMGAIDAGELPAPISLLIVDVDKFKAINDTHSHSAGDYVLRELGVILKANCPAADPVPIRYAGDEFTVFLQADLATAVATAERIRSAVATTDFDEVIPGTPVSVSAGVALLRSGMSATDLFRVADNNLYQAKRGGRDRVVG